MSKTTIPVAYNEEKKEYEIVGEGKFLYNTLTSNVKAAVSTQLIYAAKFTREGKMSPQTHIEV